MKVPAGIHTVTWQYAKDGGGSQGTDCGWLDQVLYRRGVSSGFQILLMN